MKCIAHIYYHSANTHFENSKADIVKNLLDSTHLDVVNLIETWTHVADRATLPMAHGAYPSNLREERWEEMHEYLCVENDYCS